MENNSDSFFHPKRILLLFQVITGLAINCDKSKVYHVNNSFEQVSSSIEILGCQIGTLPFKYMGAWVGSSDRSTKIWNNLTDSMKSKFQS